MRRFQSAQFSRGVFNPNSYDRLEKCIIIIDVYLSHHPANTHSATYHDRSRSQATQAGVFCDSFPEEVA
eukprot:3402696-Pleurochrysis_carterae.AAC.1